MNRLPVEEIVARMDRWLGFEWSQVRHPNPGREYARRPPLNRRCAQRRWAVAVLAYEMVERGVAEGTQTRIASAILNYPGAGRQVYTAVYWRTKKGPQWKRLVRELEDWIADGMPEGRTSVEFRYAVPEMWGEELLPLGGGKESDVVQ